MSKLETNTVDSISGTSTLTLGGSNASVVSAGTEVRSNKLSPASGTALQIGDSGDTITIPSGATIVNSGTQTGFGGANTPYFEAKLSGNQGLDNNTGVKIQFNTEYFDSAGAFNTSTYRFTPQTSGNYLVYSNVGIYANNGNSKLNTLAATIKKNGSDVFGTYNDYRNNPIAYAYSYVQKIVTLNGSSDYVEMNVQSAVVDGVPSVLASSVFGAFKLVE